MTYLVTGGGGFLGKALCRRLRATGAAVRSVARGAYPELEQIGVQCHQADIGLGGAELAAAFAGVKCVFHSAAKVDMWGPAAEFARVNVTGTENVIAACRRHGVRRLVYTSSPSVIAAGGDLCGVDETCPYPPHFEAEYPRTKALAEQRVLAAHDGEALRTLSLRPHLIFGPGDTSLTAKVLERGRAGRLVRIGNGKNLVDFSYIDDCVAAHLAAAAALETNPAAGGRAYFISQGEPMPLWDWINEVLQRHGLPPVKRSIPLGTALFLGAVFEKAAQWLPGSREPLFTRFLAREMATQHYFDISAARRELGYVPSFTMRQALDATFGSDTVV